MLDNRRPTSRRLEAGEGLRVLGGHLLRLPAVALIASFIIFGSVYLAPGDPEQVLFGNRVLSQTVRRAVAREYHLNEPFLTRYWHWLTGVVHGNFGISLAYRQSVGSRLAGAAPTSLMLVGYASLLIVTFGVLLGVLSALRPGLIESLVTLLTNIGIAIPGFVMATFLVSFFAVKLGWFPVYGPGSGVANRLWHLTLPAISLAVSSVALLSRVTSSSMREELSREHVQTAQARGLAPSLITRRHVVRNSLIPITTTAALITAGLLSGTVVIEQAFGISGLGQLLITAVEQNDFATVQAISLIVVVAFLVINAIVDTLYVYLDPRVRLRVEGA